MKPLYLKATYYRSPSSTGPLERPALCGGMPELLAPNPQIFWKHQPPPLRGMPEPLAPKEVTSINGKVGFSQLVNPCPWLSS
jgi:hypothetical protein